MVSPGLDAAAPHRRSLDYLRAARPRHWLKNLLVFLPLVAAHRLYEPVLLWRAALAACAFSLLATSIYFFNDLRDVSADRAHPAKRGRPLAAGRITVAGSWAALGATVAAAGALGTCLSGRLVVIFAFYYLLMIVYSLGAKAVPVLDVLMLACGYALRVAAGWVAIGSSGSPWLAAYCVFLFLSLALLKRYAELASMGATGAAAPAWGYVSRDQVVLVSQGLAAGYLSVLVLALYTNTRIIQGTATRVPLVWVICLLQLYWISHMWLMAGRGRIAEDPVAYACRDRTSLILVSLTLFAALLVG